MRLYEFIDPNRYLPRDTKLTDLLEQSEEADDIIHGSALHLRKETDTNEMTLLDTP
jgi:hypothetical protein